MLKILLSALILFTTVIVYSQQITDLITGEENLFREESNNLYSSVSFYKPNYVIIGNKDDQAKVQLSFKYEIFNDTGIYFGYSQTMFWMVYDRSSPFTEINFNPELFWHYGNEKNYFQLGLYEHKSNGKDRPESRSLDRSYLQLQLSTGKSLIAGINIKTFYNWNKSEENEDINDYTGYYEAKIFFRVIKSPFPRIIDKEELYIRGGTGGDNGGFDTNKGWVEAGLQFRGLFKSVQPQFFIQGFYGYGESLIGYNEKDKAIRFGILF